MPPWNAKEVRRRLPGDCVGTGILFLAMYAMGFFGANFYPVIHPVHGEMWFQFSLLFAAAPGFIMLGLAGRLDPRICCAVEPGTKELPLPCWARAAGWMLLWGGFALGGCVMFWVHRPPA
jgi:hypothetical protein